MDLEVALLNAKDGDAAGLVAAMNNGGSAALLSTEGCRSVKALPGIENPGAVLLLIEWDSVDAHNAAKASPGFAKFIEHAGPFLAGGGEVQHFRLD